MLRVDCFWAVRPNCRAILGWIGVGSFYSVFLARAPFLRFGYLVTFEPYLHTMAFCLGAGLLLVYARLWDAVRVEKSLTGVRTETPRELRRIGLVVVTGTALGAFLLGMLALYGLGPQVQSLPWSDFPHQGLRATPLLGGFTAALLTGLMVCALSCLGAWLGAALAGLWLSRGVVQQMVPVRCGGISIGANLVRTGQGCGDFPLPLVILRPSPGKRAPREALPDFFLKP